MSDIRDKMLEFLMLQLQGEKEEKKKLMDLLEKLLTKQTQVQQQEEKKEEKEEKKEDNETDKKLLDALVLLSERVDKLQGILNELSGKENNDEDDEGVPF